MSTSLKRVFVQNFKSYEDPQWIDLSELNILLGANSSGKSTALQTLLVIKQTMECNSLDIDLLLSGKYVTLGDFDDIINNKDNRCIRFGISLEYKSEMEDGVDETQVYWVFTDEREGDCSNAILSSMIFAINGDIVVLEKNKNGKYGITINGEKTGLYAKVNNLKIGDIYIEYNTDYNELFQHLLNELLEAFMGSKKIVKQIPKDKLIALYYIDEFYLTLFEKCGEFTAKEKCENETVQDIIDLIDEYAQNQLWSYKSIEQVPMHIKQNVLETLLSTKEQPLIEKIDGIIKKYRCALEEYKQSNIETDDSKINYAPWGRQRYIYIRNNRKNEKESDADKILNAFRIYKTMVPKIFENIFYVGPIREKPQGLYNIGFESVPKYVGPTGAYFASVLSRENKKREYILPNNDLDETDLLQALDEWTIHLNVANEISVQQSNSFGFSVSIENTQNKKADIMNVGIGTSQVLPVLITGLLSEKNEVLIFEQPELHLHPFSQSRLADFFVALAKNERVVMIETHSEYMLLRLRYHVLMGNISDDAIAVNFFQNNKGTKVERGLLNSYGNLEYPADFRDETQELINNLIVTMMKKGKNDDKKCDC